MIVSTLSTPPGPVSGEPPEAIDRPGPRRVGDTRYPVTLSNVNARGRLRVH